MMDSVTTPNYKYVGRQTELLGPKRLRIDLPSQSTTRQPYSTKLAGMDMSATIARGAMTSRMTVSATEVASWAVTQLGRIEEFGKLGMGWDGFSAEPPNQHAIRLTVIIIQHLASLEFQPSRIAPSVEGGIAIIWRKGVKTANIEVFNTTEIISAIRDQAGFPELEEVTIESLHYHIDKIRKYLNA